MMAAAPQRPACAIGLRQLQRWRQAEQQTAGSAEPHREHSNAVRIHCPSANTTPEWRWTRKRRHRR
jgi:hypothetical protein